MREKNIHCSRRIVQLISGMKLSRGIMFLNNIEVSYRRPSSPRPCREGHRGRAGPCLHIGSLHTAISPEWSKLFGRASLWPIAKYSILRTSNSTGSCWLEQPGWRLTLVRHEQAANTAEKLRERYGWENRSVGNSGRAKWANIVVHTRPGHAQRNYNNPSSVWADGKGGSE